jgi:hypothetical protein
VKDPDSEPRPWDSAWAVTPAAAKWRAANPPPMVNLGSLDVRRTLSRFGFTLHPPPAHTTPNLDATAARMAYTQTGARMYGPGGPTMHLAVVNEDQLVYVFHADQVEVPEHGPADAQRAERLGTTLCTAVGLLDAMTGEWIYQGLRGLSERRWHAD